jgi:hypothetical protein
MRRAEITILSPRDLVISRSSNAIVLSDDTLVRLPERGSFTKAHLIDPVESGYILLASCVDRRPPFGFFWESARKRRLIQELKALVKSLQGEGMQEVTLLKAILIPPGRGAYLKRRPDAKIARFDVALLIRTSNVAVARNLLLSTALQDVQASLRDSSEDLYIMLASNIRRIGSVDHRRPGIFLLNYFFAASERQNLDVFDYTAGWFQDETGLDNSEVMRPLTQQGAHYTVINHARWNRLTDVLPSLLFKPSFPRYVLKHFEVNRTAAMPILYRLA